MSKDIEILNLKKRVEILENAIRSLIVIDAGVYPAEEFIKKANPYFIV